VRFRGIAFLYYYEHWIRVRVSKPVRVITDDHRKWKIVLRGQILTNVICVINSIKKIKI